MQNIIGLQDKIAGLRILLPAISTFLLNVTNKPSAASNLYLVNNDYNPSSRRQLEHSHLFKFGIVVILLPFLFVVTIFFILWSFSVTTCWQLNVQVVSTSVNKENQNVKKTSLQRGFSDWWNTEWNAYWKIQVHYWQYSPTSKTFESTQSHAEIVRPRNFRPYILCWAKTNQRKL